jgi:hypothetical protein
MVIELSPLTVTPLLNGYIEFLGQLNTSCWPADTSRIDGFFAGGSTDILFSNILTRQPVQDMSSKTSTEQTIKPRIYDSDYIEDSEIGEGY